jgi:hypothetical protein
MTTNGKATAEEAPHDEAESMPSAMPRGGRFVRPGQRFISALGARRAWQYYFGVLGLAAVCILALDRVDILNLQNQLTLRQPYIVGLDAAHRINPLFPNGPASSVTCDRLCMEGELADWVSSLRCVTGEMDTAQPLQHSCQAKAVAYVAAGSDADSYVKRYYQRLNPYTASSKGIKVDVRNAHVNAETAVANRYDARWTDVVINAKNGQEVGRHDFSATIDAKSVPDARTEENVVRNPVGVVITHVEQFGVTE